MRMASAGSAMETLPAIRWPWRYKGGDGGEMAESTEGDSASRSYPQDRLGRWVVQGCNGGDRSVLPHRFQRSNRVPSLPGRLGPPKAPARGDPGDARRGAARPRVSDPGDRLSRGRGEGRPPGQGRLPGGPEAPRPRKPGGRHAGPLRGRCDEHRVGHRPHPRVERIHRVRCDRRSPDYPLPGEALRAFPCGPAPRARAAVGHTPPARCAVPPPGRAERSSPSLVGGPRVRAGGAAERGRSRPHRGGRPVGRLVLRPRNLLAVADRESFGDGCLPCVCRIRDRCHCWNRAGIRATIAADEGIGARRISVPGRLDGRGPGRPAVRCPAGPARVPAVCGDAVPLLAGDPSAPQAVARPGRRPHDIRVRVRRGLPDSVLHRPRVSAHRVAGLPWRVRRPPRCGRILVRAALDARGPRAGRPGPNRLGRATQGNRGGTLAHPIGVSMAEMDRPDLYVVARILDRLWSAPGPLLRTHLQVASNVNYDIFSRYLEWMRERELVFLEDSADGHVRVGLTGKGQEAYRKIVQWIFEVVQGRFPPT